MESQSDFSSQETITEPYVIGRIQKWMQETTSLTNLLQSIPPSDKTAVEKWLQEQKENEKPALVTLLQSILSPAETKIGSNFHLEKKAQDSEQSNKRISKAPETSNGSGRKEVKAYVVKAANEALDEGVLIQASGKMPEVRLVIESRYIRSKFLETPAKNIRYPSRDLKHMFGVVQDTVDYTVKMYLRFDTCIKPFRFWCDVVYNPFSDGCYLRNRSESSIYLSSHGQSQPEHTIGCEKRRLIFGAWRISVKQDQTTSCFYPVFDILVRDKGFSISSDNDDKVTTGQDTDIFNPTSSRITRTDLLKLADGDTVRIKDLHDDEKTYELQRIKNMTYPKSRSESINSPRPYVFYCRHSKLPSIELVAKVFRIREQMKREMEFLKQIRHHPNIISLKEADARVFALYLEELPLSLDKKREIKLSWPDAKTILFDIASALAYLSKRGIVHYDVKPANIAFSRERGAILFDFDQADYTKNPKYGAGGTAGYLPPEIIDERKSRGFPGDVWALGVTILRIMEKDTDTIHQVDRRDFYKKDSLTHYIMTERLQSIALQRSLLDLQVKVEALVYKMLEPNDKARVTAAAILREDDREPKGGIPAKKRRHS